MAYPWPVERPSRGEMAVKVTAGRVFRSVPQEDTIDGQRMRYQCPVTCDSTVSGARQQEVIVACLIARSALAGVEDHSAGWQGISGSSGYGAGHGIELGNLGHGGLHEGLSGYGGSYGGGGFEHGLHEGGYVQHQYAPAVPVSEHVEITKPVPIPVVKNVGVPVAQPVAIAVPHPVAVGVPQPYPVHVPVAQPVAIPVVKTVAVPVEKKVPYPVEKVIPVPVEKHVPIPVEKHIPVPVEKPYPIHVPVYKHVYHRVKSHGHGWSH
ncbi:unnamed protein product [Xylocopa violacea]|uniref:Uncharacterized protein n=1 Tax=Xylocopa violacea TaxID=135666 RepID=A0ABP1NIG8_XYLVO